MLTQSIPTNRFTRTSPLRKLLFQALARIRVGSLTLVDGEERHEFVGEAQTSFSATVYVENPRFYQRLIFGGSNGAGEAFADGDWHTDDLTQVIRLFAANEGALNALDGVMFRLVRQAMERMEHLSNRNTLAGSQKNIAAHYDLSNDFFKLWLDDSLMYSSAVYPSQDASLDAAATAKLEILGNKLDLRPGMHVLEIGTGWGGLAIYLARNFDVSVTTTTISRAQFDEARARVAAAGLADRITLLLEDYRNLNGQFDRIVSVEMVEAVGDDFLDGYFAKVETLLKTGGRFVMQAITIQDQKYLAALKEVDFIKKHIFPGSFIPSLARLLGASKRTHSLRLTHLEDIGLDYARTLSDWRERFLSKTLELEALGFDERFRRLWLFYFAYCEGGFLERRISDAQLVFENEPQPLQAAQ